MTHTPSPAPAPAPTGPSVELQGKLDDFIDALQYNDSTEDRRAKGLLLLTGLFTELLAADKEADKHHHKS